MTIQQVIVQIEPQRDGDPGQVTTGYFLIKGGTLSMTQADGTPVDGYSHELRPGDNPKAIAGVLTKRIRAGFMSEAVPGFNRTMRFARVGIA